MDDEQYSVIFIDSDNDDSHGLYTVTDWHIDSFNRRGHKVCGCGEIEDARMIAKALNKMKRDNG